MLLRTIIFIVRLVLYNSPVVLVGGFDYFVPPDGDPLLPYVALPDPDHPNDRITNRKFPYYCPEVSGPDALKLGEPHNRWALRELRRERESLDYAFEEIVSYGRAPHANSGSGENPAVRFFFIPCESGIGDRLGNYLSVSAWARALSEHLGVNDTELEINVYTYWTARPRSHLFGELTNDKDEKRLQDSEKTGKASEKLFYDPEDRISQPYHSETFFTLFPPVGEDGVGGVDDPAPPVRGFPPNLRFFASREEWQRALDEGGPLAVDFGNGEKVQWVGQQGATKAKMDHVDENPLRTDVDEHVEHRRPGPLPRVLFRVADGEKKLLSVSRPPTGFEAPACVADGLDYVPRSVESLGGGYQVPEIAYWIHKEFGAQMFEEVNENGARDPATRSTTHTVRRGPRRRITLSFPEYLQVYQHFALQGDSFGERYADRVFGLLRRIFGGGDPPRGPTSESGAGAEEDQHSQEGQGGDVLSIKETMSWRARHIPAQREFRRRLRTAILGENRSMRKAFFPYIVLHVRRGDRTKKALEKKVSNLKRASLCSSTKECRRQADEWQLSREVAFRRTLTDAVRALAKELGESPRDKKDEIEVKMPVLLIGDAPPQVWDPLRGVYAVTK